MKERILKLLKQILWHRKTTTGVYILLTLLAITSLMRIGFNTSTDVFFNQKTQTWIESDILEKQFVRGKNAMIAIKCDDVFTHRNLQVIKKLSDEIDKIDNVKTVTSLTTVNDTIGEDEFFYVEPLIEDIPTDAEEMAEIKRRTLRNPLFLKNIISTDGRTACITVETEDVRDDDGVFRENLVLAMEQLIEKYVPEDLEAHIGGAIPLEYYYSVHMQEDLKRFLPFVFALMIGILLLTFRKWRIVLMPLAVVSASLLYTMAAMWPMGLKINNVTVIIPPIILAIAIADSVHFVSAALSQGIDDRGELIKKTMDHLLVPCFLTTITTAFGFASLMVSRSPAIQQLGLVASIGVILAFIVTFTLLPLLMSGRLFPSNVKKKNNENAQTEALMDRFLSGVGRFNEKHQKLILLSTIVVVVASVWGMSKIVVESSLIQQLNPKMEIYKNTMFIRENLSGIHFAHVSFSHQDQDAMKHPEKLKMIERIQEQILEIPGVDKASSVVDLIKEMNESFNNEQEKYYTIPDSREMVAQYALLYDPEDLEKVVDSEWKWTILTFRISKHGTRKQQAILDQVSDILTEAEAQDIKAKLLGETVNFADGVKTVVDGQVRSLGLAMIVIFAMMFIVFKSVHIGLISIVPNLLPLIINFGIMGLTGIPLDTATSLISAIGIGIIVDDTIHFTYGFGSALNNNGGDYRLAMYQALRSKGRAIIFTSAILASSFAVLLTSQFIPTFQFGLLSATVMLNAVVADLFVLPCLFIWLKPKFNNSIMKGLKK